jgi:pSer/pThr/pTyr-binding forkhead associated (FHA) protein
MQVVECTSKNPAPENDEGGVTNIRWVREGVSEFITKDRLNEEYISDSPSLILEYKGGDLDGVPEEFTTDKQWKVGRMDDNDLIIDLSAVSRYHCVIGYDDNLGWTITDTKSTSGTWVHPKTWLKARIDVENSMPVLLRDGMIVKAHTYTF